MPLAPVAFLVVCCSVLGCSTTPSEPAATVAASTASSTGSVPFEPVAADPSTVPSVTDLSDPQAAYEQCRERVEGPESDGECTTDSDCTTGGCSGELCATPASLEGMMSTCEMLPCFRVLDSCGCNEGRCSWTVAAPKAGEGPPTVILPPKDQLKPEDQLPVETEPVGAD